MPPERVPEVHPGPRLDRLAAGQGPHTPSISTTLLFNLAHVLGVGTSVLFY